MRVCYDGLFITVSIKSCKVLTKNVSEIVFINIFTVSIGDVMSEEVLSDFIAEDFEAEKAKNEKKIDELQIFLHESMSKIISQALDADVLYDPFTVMGFMQEILKVYTKKMKQQYKALLKDRKKFEEKVEKERIKEA